MRERQVARPKLSENCIVDSELLRKGVLSTPIKVAFLLFMNADQMPEDEGACFMPLGCWKMMV